MANEPSTGLYYVQEHVRKSSAQLISHKHRVEAVKADVDALACVPLQALRN